VANGRCHGVHDPLSPFDDESIEQSLARIRSAARAIQAGQDALDPDALLHVIDQEAGALSSTLSTIATEEATSSHCRLPELVRDAADRLVIQPSVSALLRIDTERNLPAADVGPTTLGPVVDRMVTTALDHAGRGGEIALTLRRRDADALELIAEATPGVDGIDPLRDTTLGPLRESVAEGEMTLRATTDPYGCLRLVLELAAVPSAN